MFKYCLLITFVLVGCAQEWQPPKSYDFGVIGRWCAESYAIELTREPFGESDRQYTYVLTRKFNEFDGEVLDLSYLEGVFKSGPKGDYGYVSSFTINQHGFLKEDLNARNQPLLKNIEYRPIGKSANIEQCFN